MYLRIKRHQFFLIPTAAIGWDVDRSWFFEVAWLNFALGITALWKNVDLKVWTFSKPHLERFAALVRVDEREGIADWYKQEGWLLDKEDVPAAIRARGQA